MPQLPKFKFHPKKDYFLIGGITLFLFIAISGIYYLLFVMPLVSSRKSLTEAKNLSVQMKLINTQNSLAFTDLVGINPSHPEYNSLIDSALTAIDKSDKDFTELEKNFKASDFGGTREVKNYLRQEFREKFGTIVNTYAGGKSKRSQSLSEFKKTQEVLYKVVAYNPYTDLANLDLNDEKAREALLTRAQNASEGLKKVYNNLGNINHEKKDDLSTSISVSAGPLNDLIKALSEEDLDLASQKRDEFLNTYKSVSQNAEVILRSTLSNDVFSKTFGEQAGLSGELDALIAKIEELQKNLPKDPLSK